MEDSFVTKDVFYDCIPIHGNTSLKDGITWDKRVPGSLSISPVIAYSRDYS